MLCRTVRRVCLPALPVRSWFAFHRVAEYAPTVLPLAQRALAWPSRAAPQSKDCVRARPAPATIPLRKGRSACGGVLRHGGTFAVSALLRSSLRHRESPCIPCAAFIRECGLHGLVGIPPGTLQGRLAAPAAPGGGFALAPLLPCVTSPANRTCSFSRRAASAALLMPRFARPLFVTFVSFVAKIWQSGFLPHGLHDLHDLHG